GTDSLAATGTLALHADSPTGFINAGAGPMTIDAYGPITVWTPYVSTFYNITLDGVTLNSHVAATLDGAVNFLDGAVFNNLAGATVTDEGGMFGSSNGNFAPGSGQFNNDGSYILSAPGGQSLWLVPFLNSGSVNVQAGSLTLQFGC